MANPAELKRSNQLSRAELMAAIQQYAHEIAERKYLPFTEEQVPTVGALTDLVQQKIDQQP